MGHIVPCKRLKDDGLHTFLGTIGYCMKDNGKEHIEFVHHIPDDMNEGKMEYVKFKKAGLNNCESFS
jgi:hypothetical protein